MREDRVSMIQTKVRDGVVVVMVMVVVVMVVVVVVDTGEDQRGGDGAPDEGGPCQHDTDQGVGRGEGGGGGYGRGSAWWRRCAG